MKAPRPRPDDHVVSGGRVHCRKVGRDVSVEACWMCERLLGFDLDQEREIVRCAPDRRSLEVGAAIL